MVVQYMRPQTARDRVLVAAGAVGLGLVVIFGSVLLPAIGSERQQAAAPRREEPSGTLSAMLQEIEALLRREEWTTALALIERAVQLDPGSRQLSDWQARARAEMQNRLRYEMIQATVGRGEAVAAMALLDGFPADSIYRSRVEELGQRCRDLYVASSLDEAHLARRLGQCDEVRRLVRVLRDLSVPGRELDRLARRCEEGEARPRRGAEPRGHRVSQAAAPQAAAPARRSERGDLRDPF
jgi:hypothetical protein